MAKKTPGEIVSEYVPKKPKPLYAFLVRALIAISTVGKKAKFTYHFNKKEMRHKQVIILADHSSTDNYLYAIKGYPFVSPNVVIGYHNIFVKGLFRILLGAGVIPKRLYTPDMSTAISILRLIKHGASVMIFPEGIQSMAGSTQPINPATAALLKKCTVPVVLCKSYGAYLNRPRFDGEYRHGPMEFSYELLFSKKDLGEKSADEIYDILIDRFRYDDFLWNSKKKYVYKGKHQNAFGLDRILFVCPRCGKHFSLRIENDDIVCVCGNRIKVDGSYSLIPYEGSSLAFERIDEWFQWQREVVRREVEKPGFSFSYEAEYQTIDTQTIGNDNCVSLGEGRITIDAEHFVYDGTNEGERFVLDIPIIAIPSAPFVSGHANEFFHNNDYYRFIPKETPALSVKILLMIEELHNLSDDIWRKACSDVYRCGGNI